jgi:hypothetical protein
VGGIIVGIGMGNVGMGNVGMGISVRDVAMLWVVSVAVVVIVSVEVRMGSIIV